MYTIYKYENSQNGKVYIGQTSTSMEERAGVNGRNYIESRLFYNAIKKYSWSAFIPEVLETVDTQEEANEREMYYIDLFKSRDRSVGYNLAAGGDNKEMLPETKLLISSKAKERYKDKTKNPMYGRHHSDEAIEKQRLRKIGENNPMYGSKWTNTQRERSGVHYGDHMNFSDEYMAFLKEKGRMLGEKRKKRVRCIESGDEFQSATDAAKHFGVDVSTLCGQINGKQKTCKGMHFEYIC